MIQNIVILLLFQLGGETLSRAFGLPVPGPVIGLAALFAGLILVPGLADKMRETTSGLLSHLSLLFVPAGVGITAHLGTFAENGLALAAALVVSTTLAILAGVGAFLLTLLPGFHPGEEGRWYDRRFWPTVGNTLLPVMYFLPLGDGIIYIGESAAVEKILEF